MCLSRGKSGQARGEGVNPKGEISRDSLALALLWGGGLAGLIQPEDAVFSFHLSFPHSLFKDHFSPPRLRVAISFVLRFWIFHGQAPAPGDISCLALPHLGSSGFQPWVWPPPHPPPVPLFFWLFVFGLDESFLFVDALP